MKTLLTGITGELGAAFIDVFSKKRLDAYCIVRRPTEGCRIALNGFEALSADIRDRETLLGFAEKLNGKIDTIVHMASARDGASERELFDTIVTGSLNLYDLAVKIGCPKYIYFSSILASGPAPKWAGYIDECFKPSGKNLCPFGRMKLKAEDALLRLASKHPTKITILRVGNVYGAPKLSFIKNIAKMLENGERLYYNRAKKSVPWAPIYISDVMDCVFMLIARNGFDNQVYFLTGDETKNLEELTGIIAQDIGFSTDMLKLRIYEIPEFAIRKLYDYLRTLIGKPPFPKYVYSNKKIQKEIGFKPSIDLSEGLSKTLSWAFPQYTDDARYTCGS